MHVFFLSLAATPFLTQAHGVEPGKVKLGNQYIIVSSLLKAKMCYIFALAYVCSGLCKSPHGDREGRHYYTPMLLPGSACIVVATLAVAMLKLSRH